MPIGVKHEGPRKRKNPHFEFMPFAIWMCKWCDEPINDDNDDVGFKDGSYHLKCFDAMRKEEGI